MKKALIVGGTSPRGMYLMRGLAEAGFNVLNVGLLGPEEGTDVLKLKTFAPPKDMINLMHVRPGDARKSHTVESWFLDLVPDIIHFMVSAPGSASHVKTRLSSLTNVLAAMDAFYNTSTIMVHQPYPFSSDVKTAMNILERVLLRSDTHKCKAILVKYGDVFCPGGTTDSLNVMIHDAITAGSEKALFDDAPGPAGVLGNYVQLWVENLTRASKDPKACEPDYEISNPPLVRREEILCALNAVNPAFKINDGTKKLEPEKPVLDMVRACHDAYMELTRR